EQDIKTNPPCHSRACAIQDCLQRSGYQEDKCQKQIDALYECCNAFYQKNGDDASSVSCPKAPLLRCVGPTNLFASTNGFRLKMKQRGQAS
ncbi:hypothetical protein JOL62DRAFT_511686, partial [Phyllosticta paracitricarpa]